MNNAGVETARAPLHVLIVGGGIGGLCLAQGLKRSGISVAVYERDGSAHFRSQGYRITIKEEGSRALRDCLPEDLFNLCVATSIKPAMRLVVLDHQLHQIFARPLPHAQAAPDASGFGVNRLTLREILLAGLEGDVYFGKAFVGCEQLGDGLVRAHFADGTAADGTLLVGADGTNSAARRFVVPDARIDDLHSIIYGKTPIEADTMAWMPDVLVDTFNRMSGPDGVSLSVATCRTWEPVADATARIAPTLRLSDGRDYFAWTLSLSDALRDADGSTLHRVAGESVRDWHPAVRRLIAQADIPSIFPITITSAQPVKPWRTTNVTLLGDAIHTMSPGRGDGANTALRDAELLHHALVDGATQGIPLVQAVAGYETEMLRYGFEAVADSLHAPFLRGGGPATRTSGSEG